MFACIISGVVGVFTEDTGLTLTGSGVVQMGLVVKLAAKHSYDCILQLRPCDIADGPLNKVYCR